MTHPDEVPTEDRIRELIRQELDAWEKRFTALLRLRERSGRETRSAYLGP